MFKFIRNNKRIKTKNLYCAELIENKIRHYPNFNISFKNNNSNPKRYTLVKKINCDSKYKDIFTKSSYYLYGDILASDGEIVVCNLVPACTTSKYIKYKDADKIFENLNSYQKKAK